MICTVNIKVMNGGRTGFNGKPIVGTVKFLKLRTGNGARLLAFRTPQSINQVYYFSSTLQARFHNFTSNSWYHQPRAGGLAPCHGRLITDQTVELPRSAPGGEFVSVQELATQCGGQSAGQVGIR